MKTEVTECSNLLFETLVWGRVGFERKETSGKGKRNHFIKEAIKSI